MSLKTSFTGLSRRQIWAIGRGRIVSGLFTGHRKGVTLLPGFIMICLSGVVSGAAKAAASLPVVLSLFWYIEQKGIEGIVDAGFSFFEKRIFQDE